VRGRARCIFGGLVEVNGGVVVLVVVWLLEGAGGEKELANKTNMVSDLGILGRDVTVDF
jgi:hypothetical protein